MTRDEILQANPLVPFIEARGLTVKKIGGGIKVLCPFHNEKTPSLSVQPEKHHWKCFGCGAGGTVIDWVMLERNCSVKDAMTELGGGEPPAEKFTLTETYHYTDGYGRALYHVDRLDSDWNRKKFSQWHDGPKGERVNGMDGVTRVLYRLPEVIAADEVMLVEGEKCVHAAEEAGWVATTNCGGSGAWMDGYVEPLADKDVVVCHDNDGPGIKWRDAVLKSCEGKVKSVRVISAPKQYNDIADIPDVKRAPAIQAAYNAAAKVHRGVAIAIYSASEIMEQYKDDEEAISREWRKYVTEVRAGWPKVPMSVLIDHIDHVVKVAGIDHVGLGSDFDGISDAPVGLDDVTGLVNIVVELLKRGYSEEDIRKILGENFLRVIRANDVNWS